MTQQADIVLTPREGGSGAWAELQPGAYRAQVTEIEDVGVSDVYPADGPRLRFTFTLPDELDDEGAPVTLFKWCSQKLSSGQKPSNLWKWSEALGLPPQVGQPFAVSQLVGRECQVIVELKTPQAGGDARPNISNVLPPAKANSKRTPLAQRMAQPQATDDAIGPCVICGQPGEAFSSQGAALCNSHAGVS